MKFKRWISTSVGRPAPVFDEVRDDVRVHVQQDQRKFVRQEPPQRLLANRGELGIVPGYIFPTTHSDLHQQAMSAHAAYLQTDIVLPLMIP